jgi:hypothetical protein
MTKSKHGHAKTGNETSSYRAWTDMRCKCRLKSHRQYKHYGHLGINFTKRWNEFSAFYADMGERPEGHVLDRIDLTKGFSKENCKWSLISEKNDSRLKTIAVRIDGEMLTFKEIEKKYGVSANRAYMRYKAGLTGRDLVSTVKTNKKALSDDQVRAIRSDYIPYVRGYKKLSQKYKVSQSIIYRCVHEISYRSVK